MVVAVKPADSGGPGNESPRKGLKAWFYKRLPVKEFIESDGELPTGIEWISGEDVLPERFPVPRSPPQKLPE